MQRLTRGTLMAAMLAFIVPMAHAESRLTAQPGSKLWLTGHSTIHAYSSQATQLDVVIQRAAMEFPADLPQGESIEKLIQSRGVSSIEVRVGVTGLRSGKDGLDKNMYKALLAEKHPQIRFVMTSYELADGETPETLAIDARGTLSVAGVEKEIRLPVKATREGDAVRLLGSVPLLMTQFGIKPPTMMMGALKTRDEVTIHFELLVGAGDGAAAAKVGSESR
jgi:hypothetical protein